MTWQNKERYYVSRVLHSATNLNEDDYRDIQICQDRFFFDQMSTKISNIKEETFYSLRGKSSNLYLFLNGFETFRKWGTFNSETWHWRFDNVYDMAGLKSPLSEPSERYILNDMNNLFDEFRDRRINKRTCINYQTKVIS